MAPPVFAWRSAVLSAAISALVTVSLVTLLTSNTPSGNPPAPEARGVFRGASASDERPVWSATFGRTVRDGKGPLCHPGARATNNDKMDFLRTRDQLGGFLAHLGLTGDGAELGVKQGEFAERTLAGWTNGGKYYLVDPWAQQEGYVDLANVGDAQQQKYHDETMGRVAKFGSRAVEMRNFSFNAVHAFEDCSLDFVYVDAVHDYDGALRDMVEWWPKIAWGGVLAGHDYCDMILFPESKNDRTIFGVKSAADRFATAVNKQLWTTLDAGTFQSFFIIK